MFLNFEGGLNEFFLGGGANFLVGLKVRGCHCQNNPQYYPSSTQWLPCKSKNCWIDSWLSLWWAWGKLKCQRMSSWITWYKSANLQTAISFYFWPNYLQKQPPLTHVSCLLVEHTNRNLETNQISLDQWILYLSPLLISKSLFRLIIMSNITKNKSLD